jgi:penicillin G amidase
VRPSHSRYTFGMQKPVSGIRRLILLLLLAASVTLSSPDNHLKQSKYRVTGLKDRVEILRDRWGVPHIYAQNQDDMFFAQGYITAQDRLFQLDLWRRIGTGKLSAVLGPSAIPRDRIARLVRYRGDWNEEWTSYSPDAKQIAASFTGGINAYIRSLSGKRSAEFALAGYDPGLWQPEDVTARIAGLLMTGNLFTEVARVEEVKQLGLRRVARLFPPDPKIALAIPEGLNLDDISSKIVSDYNLAVSPIRFPGEQGSNNWVVDGTLTATGKPLLANDPHRSIELPSLRKTVHLIAPGWNVIGAGEPALPGVALGHNENIAFGFTIVGIDQQDLYVEKLNPEKPTEYMDRGQWRPMRIEREPIEVKGRGTQTLELHYTVHGPVLYEDLAKHRAFALKWVGDQPGTAGYLAGLRLAKAENWEQFKEAVSHYKIPTENLVYADREGNIGWIASGLAPVRKGWSGIFPVPGDTGDYEWSGYLPAGEHPIRFNPGAHFIATANNNVLPPGYEHPLNYYWAPPTRYDRIVEMLKAGHRLTIADFEHMQQDTMSLPARQFIKLLRAWSPASGTPGPEIRSELLAWDANVTMQSRQALIYEVWMDRLQPKLLPELKPGTAISPDVLLNELARSPQKNMVLSESLAEAIAEIREKLGPDSAQWTWGNLHKAHFDHPLGKPAWNLPPISRPGDGYTVNATGGKGFQQTHGASYREIIDVSNWDHSVTTNTPGESGVPGGPHYGDLVNGWANGHYHPLPYSRAAVEAAAEERILLEPAQR